MSRKHRNHSWRGVVPVVAMLLLILDARCEHRETTLPTPMPSAGAV